jgi:hypothetical protein
MHQFNRSHCRAIEYTRIPVREYRKKGVVGVGQEGGINGTYIMILE